MRYTHRNIEAEQHATKESYLVERLDGVRGIPRVERPLDVLQRGIHHLVRVRQTVHAAGAQVDEDVVRVLHAVRVGVRVAAPPLKVLAAHQAGVHVVVRQGDAAELRREGGRGGTPKSEMGMGGGVTQVYDVATVCRRDRASRGLKHGFIAVVFFLSKSDGGQALIDITPPCGRT